MPRRSCVSGLARRDGSGRVVGNAEVNASELLLIQEFLISIHTSRLQGINPVNRPEQVLVS